jgi:hypothetical protein
MEAWMERETFERLARGHAGFLREAYTLAQASQTHSDALLTWTVALMLGGIAFAPSFLVSMGMPPTKAGLVLGALSPWIVGVLLGALDRLLAVELQDATDRYFATKAREVEGLLLPSDDADAVARSLTLLFKDEGEHQARFERVERLRFWTRGFAYLAHAALGLGMLTVILLVVFA